MGERNIKHTEKKKKKIVAGEISTSTTYVRPVVTQPELITKKKKDR